jgi:two-component system phosphate regulon sensor histidine kinase PhoR
MNNKNIILIIILMTLALIGLVSLQLYWIKSAIAVEEANFRRSVNEAISIVITKLEKKEINEQFNKNREKTRLINTIDSLNRLIFKEQQKYPGIDEESQNMYLSANDKKNIEISSWENINGETTLYHDTNIVVEEEEEILHKNIELKNNIKIHKVDIDKSILNDYQKIIIQRDKLLRKSALLEDFFVDIFNLGRFKPIEKRINPYLLDSLIFQELTTKGIKTEYEFGIYSPTKGQLILQKTGKYKDNLLNRNFAYILFPSDVYMNPEYLMLYFPKEKSFLLNQLWLMLFASATLIIIIIYSFSYTIFTIFKQKKLSEIKNDFVNNMTHEIKTPIATISLACEVLNDNGIEKSNELIANYINMIKHENKRLETLVEHILQTATMEKGQLVLWKEEIDLHLIIPQAVNNVGFHVMQKSGNITQNLNAKKSTIMADKVHITNLIYNLLDNANKYSPEKPKIVISTENSSTGIIIKVSDFGIGISKANQKKIFEKFSRISTGNLHNVKGFGLGLSYVKAIVDKHQGKISIESELKKGSVFIVYLPFE